MGIDMTKKTDSVDDALLASLQKAPTKSPAPKKQTASRAKPAPRPKPPQASSSSDPIIRATVSLRQSDGDIADQIIATLKGEGVRASFSDALKIALRLCPTDRDRIIEAFAEVRASDMRGKSQQ